MPRRGKTAGLRVLVAALAVLAVAPATSVGDVSCSNAAVRAEQGFAELPDCRAAELVSPPLKSGADIAGMPTRTRVAADGGAVQYMSLGAFGDARGTSIASEYMAVRMGTAGTAGWVTHGITPGNQEAGTFIDGVLVSLEPRYMGDFSADLNAGVFFSNNEFTGTAPNVADVPNLYIRRDLRSSGSGSYQLLSACPGCSGPLDADPHAKPYVDGASEDFSHIIFESPETLTVDTVPCVSTLSNDCAGHLYEWVAGTVRLAGWIPPNGDTQCGPAPLDACIAADQSQAGQGQIPLTGASNDTPNTISRDGSRILFTVHGSGSLISGKLYMRVHNGQPDATTVQINASERTVPDATSLDATYWGASADGSKVFFSTDENLIDSDNTAENNADLYEYDVTPDAQGHHLKLLSPDAVGSGANVEGVLGEAADGSTVYFVADQQLVPGQPTSTGSDVRIFRWHDGVVYNVAKVTRTDMLSLLANLGWGSPWRVSPDGNHLLFLSQGTDELAHTGVGDSCAGGCSELYLYDATANGGQGDPPVCVSCAQPDVPAQTDASFLSRTNRSLAGQTSYRNQPMSDDGRYVFFDTGNALVPQDQDGPARDVYEYDSAKGQLHLLTSGKPGSFGGTFDNATPSGSDVFFTTRDKLSPWDVDDNVDLYDARVNGGIPGPPEAPPACTADACRAAQVSAPAFGPPFSTTLSGGGNVKAHKPAKKKVVRCRRGTVRKRVRGKVRCVKKVVHRAKAKKARHASNHAKGR